MGAKNKILSKKNKKVKQLMRRFQDEDGDNDQEEKEYNSNRKSVQNKTIRKDKVVVRKSEIPTQPLTMKRKVSDRTNDSFDIQNGSDQEQNGNDGTNSTGTATGHTKTSISSVFSKILTQDVKSISSKENPIFSEFSKPLKKVKQELRKDRENVIKKRIKAIKETRGHVLPQNNVDGPLYEKELKIQAAKGIIKILDAVKKYQETEGIE